MSEEDEYWEYECEEAWKRMMGIKEGGDTSP